MEICTHFTLYLSSLFHRSDMRVDATPGDSASGQLRSNSRDKPTRKKSNDPEFDSSHEDTMLKFNEKSQRQSRRTSDIDKSGHDTNEPRRGLRRSSLTVHLSFKKAPQLDVWADLRHTISTLDPLVDPKI